MKLWACLFLALAGSAHATINMTGRWVVDGRPEFTAIFDLDFVQVGTTLMQAQRTGTIDSTSGAFSVGDVGQCQPIIGPTVCGISGTVAPDGLTFTGTISCESPSPHGCGGLPPTTLFGWRSPPTCGNGVIDPGEQCDDGTNQPGGCCDPGCRVVASGTSCGPSNCARSQVCDGAGACVNGPPPPAPCDQCSRCDLGSATCVPDPAISCRAPTVGGAAQISLKASGARSSLKWSWGRDHATTLADFGDPVQTDGYALCVYSFSAGNPITFIRTDAFPGSHWRASGQSGFSYRGDGVVSVDLRVRAAGGAKIAVRSAAPLGLDPQAYPPLTVQLRGHGQCWGASFVQAGVKTNTSTAFVAKSSPN